ncbi:MFS transporter [bacterium]|nr:MFS transporter [bacterium]MBU1065733.1 MFS transporter [bacterium]MBU1873592.1 MFS transporter [bacterium]
MKNNNLVIYRYRWVVLTVFSIINAIIQLQWLTFAPIAREARLFYGVSALNIDLLSMIFMGVFLIVCVPASFIIDTYGIRIGVGIGAALTGIFGLFKGVFASSYSMVVLAQIGLAVGQPFIINAATKVAGQWFPIKERATAVGIATLAQFVGIIAAMIFTPMLITETIDGKYELSRMLMIYGIISFIGAILFLTLSREKPATPPGIERYNERILVRDGLRHIIRQRDMQIVLIMFFIGLGMFNAISTCIDQICEIKGLTVAQTGLIGGMMIIAGIIGAIILPILSDMFRKRKAFIIIGMVFMTPGLIGLTFFTEYHLLLISSFVLGFFLLGAGAPISFQYSAEITYPAPESTSQGLLLLMGQISGIIFIIGMNILGMIPFMITFVILAAVNIIFSLLLNESKLVQT